MAAFESEARILTSVVFSFLDKLPIQPRLSALPLGDVYQMQSDVDGSGNISLHSLLADYINGIPEHLNFGDIGNVHK